MPPSTPTSCCPPAPALSAASSNPTPAGTAWYTSPVIQPLGQAKSDTDIVTELARYMDLPDEQLKEGYESFVQKYILDDLGFTVEQLKKVDLPIPVCKPEPHVDDQELDKGLKTPTGKFELKSAIMENHPEWGLDALPTYKDPLDGADPEKYPFMFTSGSRIPNAIHSRLHGVPANRSLRPVPTADMNNEDCEALGVKDGDRVTISTLRGSCHGERAPHPHRARGPGQPVPRLL